MFNFSKGKTMATGAIVINQPKWKQTLTNNSKERAKLNQQRTLEQFKRPENQLLARLPNESLSFLSIRNFIILAAVAGIFFLGLLVFIKVSHSQNKLGMEISRLMNYQVQLLEENRRLKIELARLASLDDLEIVARRDLGLVSPSQGQIVIID
jgi:cell division protein FtsL